VVSAIAAYAFDAASNGSQSRVAIWPWVRERLPAFARA
jgi:hypothetical protein